MTRFISSATFRQLARFGVVGALGFVTDVGSFNLLRFAGGEGPLHDYPLSAKVVSGTLATIVAWLGNRFWTFRNTRRDKAHHEFLLFAARRHHSGTLIAMGCLWISHYGLGFRSPLADNISANGVGLVLATVFRFWAYRRHVFSQHGDHSGLSEIAEHRDLRRASADRAALSTEGRHLTPDGRSAGPGAGSGRRGPAVGPPRRAQTTSDRPGAKAHLEGEDDHLGPEADRLAQLAGDRGDARPASGS